MRLASASAPPPAPARAEVQLGRHAFRPSLRYRLYARFYAAGALFHLALPDAHQPGWLLPDLLLGFGATILLGCAPNRGALFVLAWACCAFGALAPLLWLGDALTQSVLLTLHALAMLALLPRGERHAMAALRILTLAVYAVAAFHKLNADFLNPAVSCASGGAVLLAENWSLPPAPEELAAFWPRLFLVVEAGLVGLFAWRPALGIAFAVAMHIPLTIVFAPAFAWVMVPGWVALLREEELRALVRTVRARWRRVLALGLAPAGLSAALYFRAHWVPYPFWQLAEVGLWLLGALAAVGLVEHGELVHSRGAWSERATRWALGPAALMLALAATPYLGLQFHHAGAMLSNLRIDRGCWNHLLVPESVRLREPYVRMDAVRVGGQVRGPDALARHARERLWHPASARAAIQRWCAAGAAPLTLDLSYRGVRRHFVDACRADLGLPRQPSGLFQTNLRRACPQQCIH